MANIQAYRKSHWKMDYFFSKKAMTKSKKARIKRALKKKAGRELFNDLNK